MERVVHPVIQSVLRQLPTGPLLDDAVRVLRPGLGVISAPLGAALTRDLLDSGDPVGVHLVATTCADSRMLWEFVRHELAEVAAAVARNPNLDDTHVGALFERVGERQECVLAIELARHRRDLARWIDETYLSVLEREGLNAAEALAENFFQMDIKLFEALERTVNHTAAISTFNDACVVALQMARSNRRVDIEVLARICQRQGTRYTASMQRLIRMTRGLESEIFTADVSVENKLKPYLFNTTESTINLTAVAMTRPRYHVCLDQKLQRISETLGSSGGSVEGALASFSLWTTEEKVSFLHRCPDLVEELLHHLPEVRVELAKHAVDQVPGPVLQILLSDNDALRAVRGSILERRFPALPHLVAIAVAAFHVGLNTPRSVWTFIEYFMSFEGGTSVGRKILGLVPTRSLPRMLAGFKDANAANLVRQALGEESTQDPFLRGGELDAVLDVPAAAVDLATWSQVAIDRVAAELLTCNLDLEKILQLRSLLQHWQLTPRQLARTLRAL